MYREDAGAKAESMTSLAAVDDERLLEALHQLLAPVLDLRRRARLLEHDDEFVAAEARAVAESRTGGPQAVRNGLQHAVAGTRGPCCR